MARNLIVIAAAIVIGIVILQFIPYDPKPRITSMCEGYYNMINRHHEDINVSKGDRKNACEASWSAIESELSHDDLEAFSHFTFKRNGPEPTPSEMIRIIPELKRLAFEGSCDWAHTAGKSGAELGLFCEALPRFAMF